MESGGRLFIEYTTKAELLATTPEDSRAYRLRNFINPQLSPDLITLVDEGWIFRSPYGTTHGTPYEYDSHVPLIFSSLKMRSVSLMDSVATVDLAPTLADILGVEPLNRVDGKSLTPLLLYK